jgi:hypothetical protein
MIGFGSINRPYPTGACAPSRPGTQSRLLMGYEAVGSDVRVDEEKAIDLVGAARYAHWLTRIQGHRQTCIAFAVSACLELLHARGRNDFIPLSPQFLYWHMRMRGQAGNAPPGWALGATKLSHARDVLAERGICSWSTCPYPDRLLPGEAFEGPSPDEHATTEAAQNYIDNSFYFEPDPDNRESGVARMIYKQLAEGWPVAIAIPVFYSSADRLETNWDNPTTTNSGQIVDPVDGWSLRGPDSPGAPGHAVCIVGFQPDPGEATGGWFIFRNSRGLNWAAHVASDDVKPRVPARGYGAISATYLEQHCWEILSPRLS